MKAKFFLFNKNIKPNNGSSSSSSSNNGGNLGQRLTIKTGSKPTTKKG